MSLRPLLFSGASTSSGCYLSPFRGQQSISSSTSLSPPTAFPSALILARMLVLLLSRSRWRSRRRYQDFWYRQLSRKPWIVSPPYSLTRSQTKPASSWSLLPEIVLSLRCRHSSDPLISGLTGAARAVHGCNVAVNLRTWTTSRALL